MNLENIVNRLLVTFTLAGTLNNCVISDKKNDKDNNASGNSGYSEVVVLDVQNNEPQDLAFEVNRESNNSIDGGNDVLDGGNVIPRIYFTNPNPFTTIVNRDETYTVEVENLEVSTYQWRMADQDIFTAETTGPRLVYSYNIPGTYLAKVLVPDMNGGILSDTLDVYVENAEVNVVEDGGRDSGDDDEILDGSDDEDGGLDVNDANGFVDAGKDANNVDSGFTSTDGCTLFCDYDSGDSGDNNKIDAGRNDGGRDSGSEDAGEIVNCIDNDEDGFYSTENCSTDIDCDDNDDDIYPGAFEECDGIDNDCNPNTNDVSSIYRMYFPYNSKQEGVCFLSRKNCVNGSYIDDYSNIQNYELEETSCDTFDNDCDGSIDEVENCETMCYDSDHGRNYYELGVVNGIGNVSLGGRHNGNDSCAGNILNELICFRTEGISGALYPTAIGGNHYDCTIEDKICMDGICIDECYCNNDNNCSDALFYTGIGENELYLVTGSFSYTSEIEFTPEYYMNVNSIRYYLWGCRGQCDLETTIYYDNNQVGYSGISIISSNNNDYYVPPIIIGDFQNDVRLERGLTYKINISASSTGFVGLNKAGSTTPNIRANGSYTTISAIDFDGSSRLDLGPIAFKLQGSCN